MFISGNRDIVGPSFASNHEYLDEPDQPMPGVRYAANTPEVMALREKELGDWTKLTLEEKKQCKFWSMYFVMN